MNRLAITVLTVVATLAVTACVTDEDNPDRGDHDQVGSGATCGSCEASDEVVNDDGTVDVCAPCDGTDITPPQEVPYDPIVDGGSGSGTSARVGPDGSRTPQQCKAEFDQAVAACDHAKRDGHAACDAAYDTNLSSCLQGVYQRCGTTSQYHYCVIQGRQQCVSETVATLQACNGGVDAAYRRCRGEATVDYYDCRRRPGTGSLYQLYRRHLPF